MTLYEQLGGIFGIASLVDYFSDAILKDPLVGCNSPNPALAKWSKDSAKNRLPGLKFMRTLWLAAQVGGPYKFVPSEQRQEPESLMEAHKALKISSKEFDQVAKILKKSMVKFKVAQSAQDAILGTFNAHKTEVVRK